MIIVFNETDGLHCRLYNGSKMARMDPKHKTFPLLSQEPTTKEHSKSNKLKPHYLPNYIENEGRRKERHEVGICPKEDAMSVVTSAQVRHGRGG